MSAHEHQLFCALFFSQYRIICFSQMWYGFLPVVLLVLIGYTVALPLCIAGYFYAHRNDLYSTAVNQRIGFLYEPYKRSAPWWSVHDVLVKMLLTGVLIYIPGVERTAFALFVCVLAICSLSYFRPHKSIVLFWLSQFSFIITLLKYLCGTILPLEGEDELFDQSNRASSIGTFIITLDICFAGVVFLTICATGFVLRRKLLQGEQKKELQFNKEGSSVAVLPISQVFTSTSMDHENEVNQVLDYSEKEAANHKKNLKAQWDSSHRKTMARVAQRQKLKESQRMRSVSVFKNLDDESLLAIVDAMQLHSFKPGEIIVQEGQVADAFFIIVSGTCTVSRKRFLKVQEICTLSLFDHFGEGALNTATRKYFLRASGMTGKAIVEVRNATVIAKDNVETMVLTGKVLAKLLVEEKINVKVLMQECAEHHKQRQALTTLRRLWHESRAKSVLMESRTRIVP